MTTRSTRVTLAALVTCGALVLAGCGSSESGDAAAGDAATSVTAPSESAVADTSADAAATSESSSAEASPSEATEEQLDAIGDIEVDNGLLSVTVTLPPDLAEGTTQADIDQAIEAGEMLDGQINDDGSVTYTMSSAQHDAILDELRAGVDELVAEEQKTNPGIYEEVTYNDEMTEFTVVVADRTRYEQTMSMLGVGLVFSAGFFQLFYGVPEGDRNVVINYVDGATGEVFDTYDARKEMS